VITFLFLGKPLFINEIKYKISLFEQYYALGEERVGVIMLESLKIWVPSNIISK